LATRRLRGVATAARLFERRRFFGVDVIDFARFFRFRFMAETFRLWRTLARAGLDT
jgi:hypothetical protein